MVVVPQPGVEWDIESCFFAGVGLAIPCPKCINMRRREKGEEEFYGDYPQHVIEFLACLEFLKNRQRERRRNGEPLEHFRLGELKAVTKGLAQLLTPPKSADKAGQTALAAARLEDQFAGVEA